MNTCIRALSLSLSVLMLSAMIACGGASVENPGVDSSKEMKSLDAEEKQKLADAALATFDTTAIKESACKFSAFFAAAFAGVGGGDPKKICQEAYDKCIQAKPKASQQVSGDLSKCNATVAEWSACMVEAREAWESLSAEFGKYSCDNMAKNDDPAMKNAGAKLGGAACKTFNEKCPTK